MDAPPTRRVGDFVRLGHCGAFDCRLDCTPKVSRALDFSMNFVASDDKLLIESVGLVSG